MMNFRELEPEQALALAGYVSKLRVKLRGIQEHGIRMAKLAETMEKIGPVMSVYLIFELYRRAAWGNYDYKDFFHAFLFMDELAEKLGNEFMSRAYTTARRDENPLVARLIVPPKSELEHSGQLDASLQEVTLGERRQWSKEFNPQRLEALMKDIDPIVIRHLLSNPKILERHVLMIVTRRPCHANALIVTSMHPKWGARTAIRLALLLNPTTPFRVSLPLLPMANRNELKEIIRQKSVSETLHAAISEIDRLKEIDPNPKTETLRPREEES